MGNKYYRTCHHCRGSRRIDVSWDQEGEPTKSLPCGECDGLGMHPTEEGEEMLTFLQSLGIFPKR